MRDHVDFVLWTGDSARHDSDEEIPRTEDEIVRTNTYIAEKFAEVFGNGGAAHSPEDMEVPVVPTFGNNDVLPHNILLAGPNRWLNEYTSLWRKFIPEEQRHGFQWGGWFYVEVIPGRLAVFSLNTLYFFERNPGVDGCSARTEPGYEHMEWLRIQLQFMRQRGMKAILMGHVPPARTPSKQLWDETCWQKYTLWLQQYRDVVISGIFGHMNIDHFLLQDTKDVDLLALEGEMVSTRDFLGDELTVASAGDYLGELRNSFATLPDPRDTLKGEGVAELAGGGSKRKNGRGGRKEEERKRKQALKKIGGEWAERYQLSIISPSIVPNYFPSLRIMEYNITGLDTSMTWASQLGKKKDVVQDDADLLPTATESVASSNDEEELDVETGDEDDKPTASGKGAGSGRKKQGGKKKRPSKPKHPDLHIPAPPPPGTPPGPAYSPQPLALTGYTQYFANLTEINNDMTDDDSAGVGRWHPGKHSGRLPKSPGEPHPFSFHFEVEYSTFNDSGGLGLEDLTVRNYLGLAWRIGRYRKAAKKEVWGGEVEVEEEKEGVSMLGRVGEVLRGWADGVAEFCGGGEEMAEEMDDDDYDDDDDVEDEEGEETEAESAGNGNGGKKHGKKRRRHRNNPWKVFVKRAFVSALDSSDLEKMQAAREEGRRQGDGEL